MVEITMDEEYEFIRSLLLIEGQIRRMNVELQFCSQTANTGQSVHPYRFKLCSFTGLKCAGIYRG